MERSLVIPSRLDKEIEELLIDIIKTVGGGGKLRLQLVEHIFQERTGFALLELSKQQTVPEVSVGLGANTDQKQVLDYLNNILSNESPLIVNCEDVCLSLRCEEEVLDCSAESGEPLSLVVKEIRASGKITKLDLSRRYFASKTELLEVCKDTRMLEKLILRDVQIQTDGEESADGFALIKLIQMYCPALEEVDITGCSQVTLNNLFESERSLQERGIFVGKSTVRIVDLFSTNPEIKGLLMPSCFSSMPNIGDRIKALVQDGVPANISYDGWSFLHTASAVGDVDLVVWLLNNSGNCKFQSVCPTRPSALDIAITCHDAVIVSHLLRAHQVDGCDPYKLVQLCFFSQLPPTEQCRALHVSHSSACNPLEVVKLLIGRSDLDFKTTFLVEIIKAFQTMAPTELREKTCWSDVSLAELLKTLVSPGCPVDIPITDLGGKTPLMCTISSPVLVKTLLDLGANSNATDKEGNTALFYAVDVSKASSMSADECLVTCQILLKSNAKANALNNYGETPLLYDASSERLTNCDDLERGCNLKIWNILAESGAEITAMNKDRKSAMHLVIDRTKNILEKIQNSCALDRIPSMCQSAVDRCIEQIKFLSDRNKELLSYRDNVGNTPLHVLADQNSLKLDEMVNVAKALIECGSKVNVSNDDEKTPLHLAKSWSMAELLLENGGKPNLSDNMGCSPLILRCQGANLEDPQDLENLNRWWDGVKFGMDPWHENKNGKNVFTILMDSGNFVNLTYFINSCIDREREGVLRTDSKGNTLLHCLCDHNDSRLKSLTDFLLRMGANVNAQNGKGDTALHIVCRHIMRLPAHKARNSAYMKLISRLLAYQARLNLKNKNNDTVLNIVWCNKKLLATVRRKVVQREPQPFGSWSSISQIHCGVLSQVARRQDCHFVEDYSYHKNAIGFGAFGNVFAAINAKDGREVALKRVEIHKLTTRLDDREIRSLVQLSSSPYIVQYIRFMRDANFTWLVLELMEGNLDDLLGRNVDKDFFPKLCHDVMHGVNYLHRNSVLHRDLKPSNVLYRYNEAKPCLKIADFGLSKNLSAGTSQGSSVFHSNAGTKIWMAPELLLSTGYLQHSPESDVFACGLIVHYMLANKRHPFDGDTTDGPRSVGHWSAVQQNIMNDSKTFDRNLSGEAEDLLVQVLSARNNDRPKASAVVKHPFFWSDDKKIRFLLAVGNQSEIGTFGAHPPTPVEQEIDNKLRPKFLSRPWDTYFPAVYTEMTSSRRGRAYVTSSGVHLVRFIRNSYAHVSDRTRPAGFQTLLLQDHFFLKQLPDLFMIVYKAVKLGNWDITRQEIVSVMNLD